MNNISILTYHHIANNGAALFAYSMQQALRELFPANTVRILDYRDVGMQAYEWLKTIKPFRQIPAFNLQRRRTFSQFQNKEFQYDAGLGRTTSAQKLARRLASPDQAAWITGMDVWNIGSVRWLPGFPNPYWLPWEGRAKKIAYAVSGYRSDDDAVEQEMDRLGELLRGFDLIGVRDRYTRDLVITALDGESASVAEVPDPTFLYEVRESSAREAMASQGIDLDRPVLGLLLFGKDDLSGRLRDHYHAKGYQLAALSMFNPWADVNLGHVLDPHQWAESFRHFSFCVTDRFHGAIFCLKNGIPFIAIEPDPLPSVKHSKLHDLLEDFNLLDCYFDPHDSVFNIVELLGRAGELERYWQEIYLPKVVNKLADMETRSREFLGRVNQVVSG